MTYTCLARACFSPTPPATYRRLPSISRAFSKLTLSSSYINTHAAVSPTHQQISLTYNHHLLLLLETTSRVMACSLSNLRSFALPSLSSRNKKTCSTSCVGVPFKGVLLSPSNLAVKAVASEGKESLDHLQRASKAKNLQQIPKSRIAQSPPLGLWDRFPRARTVQQMMDTMERIMEGPLAYTAVPVPSSDELGSGGYQRGRTPWEIKEGKGEYKMRFDMPGMTKKDVRVWVEENMLVVRAEKRVEKEAAEQAEGGEEEWSAKSFGKYSTRIALAENVEVEKIVAEVKDGVLYISIPKASAASKVVDISVQ